ncbi:MAG: ABC transporter substrate-binding protein [Ornithinimicrobium sp.]|uniref:ABC transporter substrate-binding protein n=1 Tax=Ornithinimicrobium sp. TaxID=1977084 RepID=UPI003D9B0783
MPPIRLISASAALLLVLAGCTTESTESSGEGGDTPSSAGADTSAPADGGSATDTDTDATGAAQDFPVTVESSAGAITLDEAPQQIVSLSPSATEILYAIGAGDQVVAVDSYSTYPEGTPVTDLSGFDPNVEAITGYEPDLVVVANDANDLVASLGELDIPVYVNAAPADIEGGYAGIADLGVLTGHVDQTAQTVATIRDEVDAALAKAPEAPVRVYHELDDTYFSASSYGFVGSVYEALGATNIADEADADQTGFPQLTEEAIIAADPEVIVITDQVDYTEQDVADRPGWQDITAVREGNIVTVDADIASRWGPRMPQFIDAAAQALSTAAVPAG